MKNIFFLIIFLLFLYQSTLGQVSSPFPLQSGWERVYIKNVGNFDLPPTMEVQKGKYKEFNDEFRKVKGFDLNPLTAQQKGLNEFGKTGFEKYARVIIRTAFGSPGDFEKLNFNIVEYTQADIAELNSIYKEQVKQSFTASGIGLKLVEWYPLKLEKVNGMSCIHISCKRQLQDKPFVLVHVYYFHNNDRIHSLTLSYRLSEGDYWKSDYSTVLKSFRLTNIR